MEYTILPFRFDRFDDCRYLLSNEVGEYLILSNETFHEFISGKMSVNSDTFKDIASKQIATTDKIEDVINVN